MTPLLSHNRSPAPRGKRRLVALGDVNDADLDGARAFMPNDVAGASENRARRLVDLLCIDPDQLIFRASGKIEAIFVDGWLWHPQDGLFEIDDDEHHVKFNVPLMGVETKALVAEPERSQKARQQSTV